MFRIVLLTPHVQISFSCQRKFRCLKITNSSLLSLINHFVISWTDTNKTPKFTKFLICKRDLYFKLQIPCDLFCRCLKGNSSKNWASIVVITKYRVSERSVFRKRQISGKNHKPYYLLKSCDRQIKYPKLLVKICHPK